MKYIFFGLVYNTFPTPYYTHDQNAPKSPKSFFGADVVAVAAAVFALAVVVEAVLLGVPPNDKPSNDKRSAELLLCWAVPADVVVVADAPAPVPALSFPLFLRRRRPPVAFGPDNVDPPP